MKILYTNEEFVFTPSQESFVYLWENLKNNKKYVGQTCNGLHRIKDEIRTLNNSKNVKSDFHCDLMQYGLKSFNIYILDYCEPKMLNVYEQYWIDKLNTKENGYNQTIGGNRWKNPHSYILKHLDCSVDVYSSFEEMLVNRCPQDKLYRENQNEETKVLCKYTREGFLVKIYEDSGFVADELSPLLGLDRNRIMSGISNGANNNWSQYGFIWKWSFLDEIEYTIIPNTQKRRVLQYDKDGQLIRIWEYVNDIFTELGYSPKMIAAACSKQNHSAYGYYWLYVTNPDIAEKIDPTFVFTGKTNAIPVCQYDRNGKLLKIYESANQASNITGINTANINSVCKGNRKSAGNYIWKYYFNESIEERGDDLSKSLS